MAYQICPPGSGTREHKVNIPGSDNADVKGKVDTSKYAKCQGAGSVD